MTTGSRPPSDPIPARRFTTSAALHAHLRSHKRFVLSWTVFRQHLTDHCAFDSATDAVVYAKEPAFEAKMVRNEAELNEAFREMRNGRGGVGFWVVRGDVFGSKVPVLREEFLAETFFDGEDDQELSESEDERVIKWAKGLVKAEPPISNTTTYK
ncbi:unnamed protein product [Zymoseptoria tritici ST99CH_1A5]|nr:unnamed protein product [Zymoseptoria tritici ST99CH_3D1]SMY19312.1 unnamed protein product [Zymoseptoria tritici ST99CH_1A5]